MNQIDQKDRRILHQLDMHARLPINEIAKNVQCSREIVEYRIQRLHKLGIISGAHTVFDLDLIGYRSFRLLLRLFKLNKEEKERFLNYLIFHHHTWWVASIGGRWDIIINFLAKDAAQFNHIFEELVTRYGQYIQEYEILTYINIHDYPRKYILLSKSEKKEKIQHSKLNSKSSSQFHHSMQYNPHLSLDTTDLHIMTQLANNAQHSYTQIAQEVGLTRNAIKGRIHSLEKNGLILGYRLSFHPSKFGRSSYLLLLNINNLKQERERELITFAKFNSSIIFVVKHIGKYRITFECEVENEYHFHELLSEIRDRFNDIIIDFDFFPIFYDHKINYFPLGNISLPKT